MVVASASTEIGSLSTLQRLHDITCCTATYLYHQPQFIGSVLNCLYQCVACLICIQMCCISSLVVCMFLLHVLRDSHVECGMTGLPDVYGLTHEIQQGFQEYRLSNNTHCEHQHKAGVPAVAHGAILAMLMLCHRGSTNRCFTLQSSPPTGVLPMSLN